MKIISVVGARPQFVKCAPVSWELRKQHTEILVHTGQHYDPEMSEVFFEDLRIPKPKYHLGVGSGSHAKQTGECLAKVEEVLVMEKPDLVLVYGDTNSTLAGALAAAKLHIPVAHVEAGLRSFDRTMPEELNRIITDHLSDMLFCPTETAVDNLRNEGITRGVYLVGDVMADVLKFNKVLAEKSSRIIETFCLNSHEYYVATVHRPTNTDHRNAMTTIIRALEQADEQVVFPVHPRTRKVLLESGQFHRLPGNIRITEPLGYLDMIRLLGSAKKILTDSGGIQKEAYMLGVPCVTLRENTEWVETLHGGWNVLTGADEEKILAAIRAPFPILPQRALYPTGASKKIREIFSSSTSLIFSHG
ncbi:MAG: UDP-N-acetylglucosamine 2-epimerase (non-hydrolyzing) [Methanoregula sp.]